MHRSHHCHRGTLRPDHLRSYQANGRTSETQQYRQPHLAHGAYREQLSGRQIWISLLSCRQRMGNGFLRHVFGPQQEVESFPPGLGHSDGILTHLYGSTLPRRHIGGHLFGALYATLCYYLLAYIDPQGIEQWKTTGRQLHQSWLPITMGSLSVLVMLTVAVFMAATQTDIFFN